jgi:hypothetical protein
MPRAHVLQALRERRARPASPLWAAAVCAQLAADRVIVAGMPRLRSAMHLDTVFTLADRDLATAFAGIVDGIHTFSLRPGDKEPVEVTEEKDPFTAVVADALDLPELRVLPTGGVYLGGGIPPRILPLLRRKQFIARHRLKKKDSQAAVSEAVQTNLELARQFYALMRDIAYPAEGAPLQIIYTTHSGLMVDIEHFDEIVVVRRPPGQGTVAVQADPESVVAQIRAEGVPEATASSLKARIRATFDRSRTDGVFA